MPAKDKNGNIKQDLVILKEYFGLHPNQTLTSFHNEVKALSEESKKELVEGAAKELGYTMI